MTRQNFGRLLVAPSVILLLAVGLGPLFFALYASLYRQPPNPAMPSYFYGLGNLRDLLKDQQFLTSIQATAIVLVTAVPLQMLLGFILAQALSQIRITWRGPLSSLLLIPSALAPIVVGVTWWMLFSPRFGPINAILERWFGVSTQIQWPVAMPWALISIIIATVWEWTPFVGIIFLGGLVSIPDELVEAAVVDGAGAWQKLRYVTLPLLRPYFFIAGLLMIIEVTRLYEVPWFITMGGPGNETVLLGIFLFKLGFQYFDLGRASMLSVLVLIMLSIIATLYIQAAGTEEFEAW
ncbi:MAG TPA: sugar ABC transporter permease [Caldilineae bacterium]|jgi:multiple sugar transport system permease protein|nr:sugar ABC transporter permease [Caldilineae bacterium]